MYSLFTTYYNMSELQINPNTLSQQEKIAINISLGVSVSMLAIKWFAYLITGSVAILSDASETIIHIIAVSFAAYSLRVAYRPPDDKHHFGYDKITFFSAGFEGALIILAAVFIIYTAVHKWISGIVLEQLGFGTVLVAVAGIINLLLGLFLIRTGKKFSSLILIANGKHTLTDVWTSGGVIIGLSLALWTGWTIFDPLLAIFSALNIVYSGGKLVWSAVVGLLDRTNYVLERKALDTLAEFCTHNGIDFHRLRLRESGTRVYVDFHLQFPDNTPIKQAHQIATQAEETVATAIGQSADVISHLESRHSREHT